MTLAIATLYMIVNTICFIYYLVCAHIAHKDMNTHDMIWYLAWMLFFAMLCT